MSFPNDSTKFVSAEQTAEKTDVVGTNVRNVNAFDKITGKATYSNDVQLKGMLHAKCLRSPHANAEITDIDASAAEALPGVELVMTYKSAPEIFSQRCFYVGAEVAFVVAKSEDIAEAALELIKVEYEVMPFVVDPREARKEGSPQALAKIPKGQLLKTPEFVFIDTPESIPNAHRFDRHQYFSEKNEKGLYTKREIGEFDGFGDVDKGFAEADVIVEEDGFGFGLVHTPFMGNDCTVADYSDDKLTVYTDSQWLHGFRSILCLHFGLSESKVNLVAPVTAGSFGGRLGSGVYVSEYMQQKVGGGTPTYTILATAASMALGKPVRYEYTKQEDMLYHWGRGTFDIRVKLGFKKDGTLTTIEMDSWRDATTGQVLAPAGPVMFDSTCTGTMLYSRNCEHSKHVKNYVHTNSPGHSGWQGWGNPEMFIAMESTMDIAAEKLGMDPIELRKKNHMRPGDNLLDLTYEFSEEGHYLAGGDISKCLDQGAEKIGWDKRTPPTEKSGRVRSGLGVALTAQQTGGEGLKSSTIVKIQALGNAMVTCSYADLGQGGATAQMQIAAEVLGLPIDKVSHVSGDTDSTPYTSYQACSSGTIKQGYATYQAAMEARDKLFEKAAPVLGVTPDMLETKDGLIFIKGNPEAAIPWIAAFMSMGQFGPLYDLIGYHAHVTGSGACAAETAATYASLDVDTETGHLSNVKIVHAQDVGKAIFPKAVEGVFLTIHHGVEASAAGAELILDPQTGKQVNNNWVDYPVATILDSEVEPVIVETPGDTTHPYGASGIGQSNQSGIAPAIANAIYNATGARVKDAPFTPAKILEALGKLEQPQQVGDKTKPEEQEGKEEKAA
ncbi:xanthine dehydrogenase family protein molybdopterin-binding subunit [Maricurvus nonylphenolicus]|uniref:xanthine dehydrogenase family protein molybdopterin-binding subunit n=1 Tax=Maricurvus nonylphenolicus TaxID=1008307 RepID=UPI0036F30347